MSERDLTREQFLARAAAYGWTPQGFMGYFRKEFDGGGAVCVSVFNAGTRRRAQLAHLIQAGNKYEAEAKARKAELERRKAARG